VAEHGYLKQVGDQGTLAVNPNNGSTFGIPNAAAPGQRSRPYGASPQDHDAFVRRYFIGLGMPADQIARVHAMTMLEVSGSSDATAKPRPMVTAYYSVLDRAVHGVSVPDSFAWARVDAEGHVIAEAVYWPALPGDVVSEAKGFSETLSDKERESALKARMPANAESVQAAIRHSSAWVDVPFDAFASYDVIVRTDLLPDAAVAKRGTSPRLAPGEIVVRHFDAEGVERFLPQERRTIGRADPQQKRPT
jgi:hypothetical protein